MRKILIGLLSLLTIIILGTFIYLKSTVKDYSQSLNIKGISKKTEVLYDDYGIPHIYASNRKDAFQTLGYVQASDRLFQMELLRRVGGGKLSEILGDSLIKADKFIRTVGINENAKRAAIAFENEASPEVKECVHAFLTGVNQYIEEGKTPIEFHLIGIEKTPFTVTDMYRILGYMGFGFSMELKNEPILTWINNNLGSSYVKDLSIDMTKRDSKIPSQDTINRADATEISENINAALSSLPVPIFYGSNSWVISGKKTKSGKVLFANDTHIGFSQPSVWYEAHIETPDLKLYGNFLAGIPYPLVAHNGHHSWGLTIFPNDAADLFNETIKGEKVLYKNKWTELEYRKETLKVKGGKTVEFTVTSTPHGPLIHELSSIKSELNTPVSLWFTANKITDKKLEAIALLSTSRKFEDFEKAARNIDSPGLNIMYGDIDGNIGWYGASYLIKRPEHTQPKLTLNGGEGNDDPLGFYDFKYNPKNINPECGFVISANNQPDSINGIIHPGYYYAGARYKSINQAISNKNDWDINSMKELVMNNQSPDYPKNAQIMLNDVQPKNNLENKAKDILTHWDGKHSLESIAPTIYYKLLYHILESTMVDEIGTRRFELLLGNSMYLHAIPDLILNDSSLWWDNTNTKQIEKKEDIFKLAFSEAIKELTIELGDQPNKWTWNRVHFLEHPHPAGKKAPLNHLFNVGPYPVDGGEEVINKMAFQLNGDGKYISRSGPAMRILLDFADLENSISINPTGASGNFMNPHYDDQALMYVNGEFRRQKMNRSDIENNMEGKWILVPQ